ncbi:MAG: NYN domain-containing protein [Candidatus Omnitrophota bacterium]
MSLQYVIDGYNIINHPLFERSHKQSGQPALNIISFIRQKRLTGSLKNKIILVFDGFPQTSSNNCDYGEVSVIFSRKISADEKIKKIVEESLNRKNIIVVSNDREIKCAVNSLGACSMQIEAFVNKKEKNHKPAKKESLKDELNYSQKHDINEELEKAWLKK